MPEVTVLSKPKGEPIASTHSPTFSFSDLPSFTVGRLAASTFSSATSVRASEPIRRAFSSRLSLRVTIISSASATT
ncbi:hypothetical protein D3C85_1148010 [compost metagenome]